MATFNDDRAQVVNTEPRTPQTSTYASVLAADKYQGKFRKIFIQGDGNCFYRAVSQALFGSQEFHFDIRVSVVSQITKCWEKYGASILDPRTNNRETFKDAEEYREYSLLSGTYATAPEIQACGEARKLCIRVHQDGKFREYGDTSSPTLINVLFTGPLDNGHFTYLEPLVPVSSSTPSPVPPPKAPLVPLKNIGDATPNIPSLLDINVTPPSKAKITPHLTSQARSPKSSKPLCESIPSLLDIKIPAPSSKSPRSLKRTTKSVPSLLDVAFEFPKKTGRKMHQGSVTSNPVPVHVNRSDSISLDTEDIPQSDPSNCSLLNDPKCRSKKSYLLRPAKRAKRPSSARLPSPPVFTPRLHCPLQQSQPIQCPTVFPSQRTEVSNPTPSALPHINVTIDNCQVTTLVDSGAAISCIDGDSSLARKLRKNYVPLDVELTAANNTPLKAIGLLPLTFYISGNKVTHSFVVCRKLITPLILASDFLDAHDAVINYKKKIVQLQVGKSTVTATFTNQKYDQCSNFDNPTPSNNIVPDSIMDIDHSGLFSKERQVFPVRTIILKPRKITYVPVSIYPHAPESAAFFQGKTSLLTDRNLKIPDSVINANTKYYPVLNLNTYPKRLTRETSIGIVDPTPVRTSDAKSVPPVSSTSTTTHVQNSSAESMPNSKNGDAPSFKFDINGELPVDQQNTLRKLLDEYRDVFASRTEEVRQTNVASAYFELIEPRVICQRPYKMSADQTKAAHVQIQKMLAANFIEPSFSVYNCPIMLLKKRSGEYRFISDFRNLNKFIKPISYSMPRTDVYIENLKGNRFFSNFDFRDGYSQLPLDESCRDFTSFEVPGVGKFRHCCLPQGLACSPSIYQMFLDHLLVDLKYKYGISNYFDDACIGTPTFESHVTSLRVFLNRLREANLSLNPSKCKFGFFSISTLGLICDGKEVRIDLERVRSVRDMPPPRNHKQAKSVYGFYSYFRKFINNFARLAQPIVEATRATQPFFWGPRQQEAMDLLRDKLLNSAPLKMFDNRNKTRVKADASKEALGAICEQQCEETGKWRPVAFASRATRKNEKNFPIMHLECQALVFAVEQFRSFLIGLPTFELITDHQALLAIPHMKNCHSRMAKFILKLSDFNYKLRYVKGKSSSHTPVDALSRVFPQTATENTTEAERKQCDPPPAPPPIQVIDARAANAAPSLPVSSPETALRDKIVLEQNKDGELRNLIEALSGKRPIDRYQRRYVLLDNILMYRDTPNSALVVVPRHMQNIVMEQNHDSPIAGHFAVKKTAERIRNHYWWPSLQADVTSYVQSCHLCQTRKSPKRPEQGF